MTKLLSRPQSAVTGATAFRCTSRGIRKETAVDVDEARGVDIVLRAGEMSLHDVRMVHGSPPNRSDDRRIGFAIRYIATSVKQLAGERDGAMLVRGVDDYHHFAPERAPAYDLAPEARAHHAEAMARSAKISIDDMGGSGRPPSPPASAPPAKPIN